MLTIANYRKSKVYYCFDMYCFDSTQPVELHFLPEQLFFPLRKLLRTVRLFMCHENCENQMNSL